MMDVIDCSGTSDNGDQASVRQLGSRLEAGVTLRVTVGYWHCQVKRSTTTLSYHTMVQPADYLVNGGIWHCIIHEGVPLVLFVCLVELIKRIVGQAGTSDASVRRAMKRAKAGTLAADADTLAHYKELGLVSHQAGHAALISLPNAALVARQYGLSEHLIQQLAAPTAALPLAAQAPAVLQQQPVAVAPQMAAAGHPPSAAQQPAALQEPIASHLDVVMPSSTNTTPSEPAAAGSSSQHQGSRMVLLSQLHPANGANTSTPVTPATVHTGSASTSLHGMQLGLAGVQHTSTNASASQPAAALGTSYQQGILHPSHVVPTDAPAMVLAAAPRHLPVVIFTTQQLELRRYRLPPDHQARPFVDAQLALMQEYFRAEIDLARPEGVNRLAESSWETVRANTLRFTGFLTLVRGVRSPTLHHYLNMDLVVLYIKYLRDRHCSPATLAENAEVAIKVVTWLLHTNQLPTHIMPAHVQSHLVHLERLSTQAQRNIPPKPPKPVTANQLTPEELTMMVQSMYTEVEQFATSPHATAMTISEAERLMEVCMACCFWGYLEPLRSSGVRSITGPWYTGVCPHSSCTMPETCQGNKIYYLDESRSSLQLVLTHLKNSHRRSFIPVSFTLPQELTAIFIPLIEVARPKLMRTFEEHPYLFINPNTGAALAAQQVSQAFRKAFAPDVRILVPSPRECRSWFVGLLRRQHNKIQAPFPEHAAALVMSNLTRTWDAVYDRQRAARLQQEAVDGMRSIRQQLISYLPNLGQQQQGLAAPAAATETLAASGVPDLVSDSALSLPAAAATSTIDVASEHAAATKSDDCFSDDDDSSSDEDDDDLPPSSATARPSVPSQTLQSQPYLNDFNAQASQQQQQQQLASQPRCVPSASSYHHKSGQMHQQQRTTALLVSGTLTSALQPTQGAAAAQRLVTPTQAAASPLNPPSVQAKQLRLLRSRLLLERLGEAVDKLLRTRSFRRSSSMQGAPSEGHRPVQQQSPLLSVTTTASMLHMNIPAGPVPLQSTCPDVSAMQLQQNNRSMLDGDVRETMVVAGVSSSAAKPLDVVAPARGASAVAGQQPSKPDAATQAPSGPAPPLLLSQNHCAQTSGVVAPGAASTSRAAATRAQPLDQDAPQPPHAAQSEAAAPPTAEAEAALGVNLAEEQAAVAVLDDGAAGDDAVSISSAAASSLPDMIDSESDATASVSSAGDSSLPDMSDDDSDPMSTSSDGSVDIASDPDSDFVIDLVSSEDNASSSSADSSSDMEMMLEPTESEDYDLD